ncbi:MAG: hypothetical protein L6Q54_13890 [Leptospiraceae bacterium]|nr:hypothetical protein [Leptospiraceae bacterium]MCK6382326.1 hypothetical protein [Leptospiraceae bacterium]NUM40884.1 hypothetical protein [Leptospiraceae bacterium]
MRRFVFAFVFFLCGASLCAVQPTVVFFSIHEDQNFLGIFTNKKTYDRINSTNPGVFLNLNKNFSEKIRGGVLSSFSNYETIKKNPYIEDSPEVKLKKTNYALFPYLTFYNIKVGVGYEKEKSEKKFFFTEVHLFENKKIFFLYSDIQKFEKEYSFGVKSGEQFYLTFQAGKKFYPHDPPEFLFSILIGFKIGNSELGFYQSFPESKEKSESTAFLAYNFSEQSNSGLLGKEKNPIFEEEIHFNKKKKNVKIKNEKIVYPLTLDELLKEKIPLAIALKIRTASKSKDSYSNILKTLPQAIVKKLNYLQYKKSQSETKNE